MPKSNVIAVIGGDRRLEEAVKKIERCNEVLCFGCGNNYESISNVTCCETLVSAVSKADIILLGLPCSKDDITVYAPLCDKQIRLENILESKKKHSYIVGGKLPVWLKESNENCLDYYCDESLLVDNALLTAEGALMLAIQHTDISINGAKCVVTGSGRVAKAMIKIISALNGSVSVVARRPSDIEFWNSRGLKSCSFTNSVETFSEADIIFNTVPAKVLDSKTIDKVKGSCVIIDLASSPGGVDFDYAKSKNIKVVWGLELPGKTAPITAGNIIYKTVKALLLKKGVKI